MHPFSNIIYIFESVTPDNVTLTIYKVSDVNIVKLFVFLLYLFSDNLNSYFCILLDFELLKINKHEHICRL